VPPPHFPINASHAAMQKKFIKAEGGNIGTPCAKRQNIVRYVDNVRDELIKTR
jgi:ATP-dependent DNA helicase UvrD/PcrA